jgi:hypothetical protein
MKCNQEDKHDHKGVYIVGELEKQNGKWKTLKNDVSSTFSTAENAYKELWPLIVYLEEAMMKPGVVINKPVKWLTTNFNIFKALND